jgi:hypothetical protein
VLCVLSVRAKGGGMNYEEQRQPTTRKGPPPVGNFVAPLAKREPVTIDAPAWMVQREPLNLAAGWQTIEGAQEHTSAMDRAKALRVRLVPFLWGWGGLSFVVGAAVLYVAKNVPVAGLLTLLLFSALTAFTYYKLNHTDYEYSREGTEHHKVNVAADLAKTQMKYDAEARRDAWNYYVKRLNDGERGR